MSAASSPASASWADIWPDVLAFVLGLGMAWWFQWHTTDLVWSLWLSSLSIGYAIIVVNIFRPALQLMAASSRVPAAAAVVGETFVLAGSLFALAFFTVHFGMFHFVHSIFLNSFFPVDASHRHGRGLLGGMLPIYAEVFRRYWPFLIVTAVAERAAFRARPKGPPDNGAVTPEAIIRRKAQAANSGMMEPYKNVMRMHLLIFFFAFAHFARLENFAVYAVVYFVYFFPWRLLQRSQIPPSPTGAG
ncbi:MAG TPA: DUF6498-containing protein [Opitutaceae bacterium]|nr:DUF6498-containing protein [Opitutaceae bacterium]